jgi:hypothetical protein
MACRRIGESGCMVEALENLAAANFLQLERPAPRRATYFLGSLLSRLSRIVRTFRLN